MLEDRDYMRQPAYSDEPPYAHLFKFQNWSLTVWVIVLNAVVFLVECACSTQFLSFKPDNETIYQYFALSKDGLAHGYVWQLITYQFMHASFLHIFFNCWAILVFGRFLESVLGARHFILLLLSSGVVGGLVQVGTALLWPHQFDGNVVGASAGAFGLVAAFATLFPERELTMLVFMIIPVRLRAKTLLLVSAMLAFAGIAFPGFFDYVLGGNVANAAHLGGMLAGLLYVRFFLQGGGAHGRAEEAPWQPRPPVAPPAKATAFWRAKPGQPVAELSPDELLKTQVDPILDKISAQGLQSLTAREREILEKASGKLAKR